MCMYIYIYIIYVCKRKPGNKMGPGPTTRMDENLRIGQKSSANWYRIDSLPYFIRPGIDEVQTLV